MTYRCLLIACAGLTALLYCSGTALAKSNKTAAKTQSTEWNGVADFDYYLFAMSIAPGFCAQNTERAARKMQCEPAALRADFAASPVTIHGLWPNRQKGKHPFFCAKTPETNTHTRQHCALPAVQEIDTQTQQALKTAMPGGKDCLDRWEWAKHGTCSGLNQDRYFDLQVEWLQRVNKILGASLLKNAGQQFDITQWRAQAARLDPELAQNLQFTCKSASRKKGKKYPSRKNDHRSENRQPDNPTLLVEVKLQLNKDGKNILPLRDARRGQSGCRDGQAFIVKP